MGISLSGGPYGYNRFDMFEGKGASDPHKMKAKVDAAAVKKVAESEKLKKADKKQEAKQEKATFGKVDEVYKGKHGQSDKEYMDSRSDAGKQISGDSKESGASYSHRSFRGQGGPAKPGEKQKMQGRMTDADRNELAIRKKSLKKKNEELNNHEEQDSIMEKNDQRMAMYSRALGIMGAHYSGSVLDEKKQTKDDKEDESLGEKDGKESSKKQSEKDRRDESKGEKKADKDYDGDGKVESSKEEYFGSKDKAIKKAMAKEEVEITKEDVVQWMVHEGYANNEVSAEILHQHISDDFLEEIEQRMLEQLSE